MKNFVIVAGIIVISVVAISCGSNKREPGRAYMPDMYYSRAYETYGYNDVHGEMDTLKRRGILYNALPVAGTMARGDVEPYPFPNSDTGYKMSVAYTSPYDSVKLNKDQMKEAERLFLVNCAICHGTKLDGNGPLYNGGNGPYPSPPRNLMDDYSKKLADGTIYHVIEYGKNLMGSYASQLRPEQRWWVIKYIRSKQGPATDSTKSATASNAAASNTTKDSNSTAKK